MDNLTVVGRCWTLIEKEEEGMKNNTEREKAINKIDDKKRNEIVIISSLHRIKLVIAYFIINQFLCYNVCTLVFAFTFVNENE